MSSFSIISRPIGTVQCFVLQRDDGAEFEILSGYGAGLNACSVTGRATTSTKWARTQTPVAASPRSRAA